MDSISKAPKPAVQSYYKPRNISGPAPALLPSQPIGNPVYYGYELRELVCNVKAKHRFTRVVDSTLPSLGSVIFLEIVFEVDPCTRLAVEFGQGDLVGTPFQRFGELGDGGVGESGAGASHGVRGAAGAVGGGR